MAKFYDQLDDTLLGFIAKQHMFFNASAPNSGRINVSPKGMDTFRVLNEKTVAYLDLTGSENETAAHIAENGRLTLMFCSFDDRPLIMRIYGRGRIVRPQDEQWKELKPLFPDLPGARQIIILDIESAMTSCGFAVPQYQFKGDRTMLTDFAVKRGEESMDEYRRTKNVCSMDGLPTYLFEDPPS